MKKIANKIAMTGLVVASAFGDGGFIGFEGGSTRTDIRYGAHDIVPQISVRAGYATKNYKYYFGYVYNAQAKKDHARFNRVGTEKWQSQNFIFGADVTPEISKDIRFVAGAYAGYSYMNLDLEAPSTGYSSSDNAGGFLAGLKSGLIFDLKNGDEFELGVKADKTWYKKTAELKKQRETKISTYIGYNYK
ncbi:hypothetical protein [Campylobacter gastrosuis]|uniref:Outer membrane protein beta-barrel domain-containing protein n=1 Tax=Campylobacter gastrosuis TaxID=2974576 RepID=A0ABT7HRR2_9BACT|nr:hypothetical protein [Campylobacter gastrosuis]MDL0089089.1 hypothetical protein [Campylobacter gastrosuis]